MPAMDLAEILRHPLPLFPLPDHVFLPGLPTPYRIFEPRYRALVQDLLQVPPARRWLAIPRLAAGWEADEGGRPAILQVATAGRLVRITDGPEGTFFVIAQGIARCRLTEVESGKAYRLARAEPYLDEEVRAGGPGSLSGFAAVVQLAGAQLRKAGMEARDVALLLAERADPDLLVFRLASLLLAEPDQRQKILLSRTPAARLDLMLEFLGGQIEPDQAPS